ncbi:MAG: cytochrome c5 family protein [Pseudomonadales bacterium]|nr:cytochrome c5 family protein [Halioglobus sp.]MCP5121196.1 cytochrome c5 family protein [Pseudomonadales bacterium]MCP5193464.1 cytochrome c5 family protein [Pseudomonadales bacterium]
MKKLLAIVLTLSAATAFAQPDMAKYDKSCKVCHASGAAGAPKTGDAAAWEPRTAKGMEVLLVSVNKGLNAMPPKGMCFDCSDADYTALIEYMSTPAQ